VAISSPWRLIPALSAYAYGASRLGAGEENLVRHAFDRGINYFDTAESYTGGESESTIGNALLGKRDKIYITSKVSSGATERKEALMTTLEGSLQRLRTDYVDIYFNHAVNDVRRLQNPEWSEFTARAKQQGKIRAVGMSGHAGHLLECLDYALESGGVDVILVAYNFGQDPAFYDKLTRSFDFIARHLARAVGLGGRRRGSGSYLERARVNVRKGIRAALRTVAETHTPLGEHLAATVRTGTLCSYKPDPRVAVPWTVLVGA